MSTLTEPATETNARPLWRRSLPVAIWLAVIFFASTALFAPEHTSVVIDPILRVLRPHADDAEIGRLHILVRKGAHVAEYAVLAILLARVAIVIPRLQRVWFGISLVVLAFVAASDEFHQRFVPGRSASWRDVLIDIAGGSIALALLVAFRRLAPGTAGQASSGTRL